MLIVIGSTNPVKINAATLALSKIYPDAEFKGIEVPSLVSNQPKSEEETRTGAYNRAQVVMEKLQPDFALGLEGGVMETEVGMMTTAWCCIIDKNGTVSFGGGMNFHLPQMVTQKIRQGYELGQIMDEILHEKNWKTKGGAIEIFTNGILTRTKAYQRLVELAMTKFVASKYYN
ncbi:inosine/xanthosine triphosphatase [Candidatus Beckwithbacteria bacterium]|nr:inosine/xanthosine triphosphatase [Candidatus Beckwithbacteria bacterium]